MSYESIKAKADRIHKFTISEAKAYSVGKNILGMIMVANLKCNGWYACRIDGVRTFFQLVHTH